jgi:hypothetical protein
LWGDPTLGAFEGKTKNLCDDEAKTLTASALSPPANPTNLQHRRAQLEADLAVERIAGREGSNWCVALSFRPLISINKRGGGVKARPGAAIECVAAAANSHY